MDADTKWLVENKLKTEIDKLRDETNASVETLALMNKEARDQMKAEMLYAIRTAAEVAKADLDLAIADGVKKMIAFEEKSAEVHGTAAAGRGELKAEIAANADEITRMIKDAVDTDAAAQTTLMQETAKALEETNTQITAHADQMKEIAKKSRADIAAFTDASLEAIKVEHERANGAIEGFQAEDAARQAEALKFMEEQLAIAAEESKKKFGDAYEKLADDRAEAEEALGSAVDGLNDSLRKQAADQVATFRKEFAAEIYVTHALVKNTAQVLTDRLEKVSAELMTMKAEQLKINSQVEEDLSRVEKLANDRFSKSKKARGKLRQLMDENKAAAAAEVAALSDHLNVELEKARAVNAHNKIEMAKDLSEATELFQEKLGAQQKAQLEATNALNEEVSAAVVASANALAHAKEGFDSKIVMLTNTVTAHSKEAKDEFARMTGVVNDYNAASEADRHKALDRAISIGEAKAKAVAQRVAEHLKDTKRYLQVELNAQVEAAADNVLKIAEGIRCVCCRRHRGLCREGQGPRPLLHR